MRDTDMPEVWRQATLSTHHERYIVRITAAAAVSMLLREFDAALDEALRYPDAWAATTTERLRDCLTLAVRPALALQRTLIGDETLPPEVLDAFAYAERYPWAVA